MLPKVKKQLGFTLIEVIVVIALLAILATIVLVAINPAQNSADARNTKRRSDVLQVLNAVNQHYVANGGFPTGTPAAGDPAVGIKSAAGGTLAAFCNAIVPTYIAALPFEPTNTGPLATENHFVDCADYNTGYNISIGTGNRVTVTAPLTDDGPAISVTR